MNQNLIKQPSTIVRDSYRKPGARDCLDRLAPLAAWPIAAEPTGKRLSRAESGLDS
jgi:hypothetical protein